MDSEVLVKGWWYTLFILLPINMLLYWFIFSPAAGHIVINPSGKGVVALIRFPGHAPILINSGSDASVLRLLGTNLSPWERTLGAVVLTDGKSTHAGGAAEVFSRYAVTTFMRLGVPGASTQEAAIATATRLGNIHTTPRVPYGSRLVAPGLVISLTSPDRFSLTTQKRTLVVSSTTSVLAYTFDVY